MALSLKRSLQEMTLEDMEIYAYAMASLAQESIHEAKFDIKTEKAMIYLDKAAESLGLAIAILNYMHEHEDELERSERNGCRRSTDPEAWNVR